MAYSDDLTAPVDDWVDATGGVAAAAIGITANRGNLAQAEGVLVRFDAIKPDASVTTGHFMPLGVAWQTVQLDILNGRAWVRAATDKWPVSLFVTAV